MAVFVLRLWVGIIDPRGYVEERLLVGNTSYTVRSYCRLAAKRRLGGYIKRKLTRKH